MSAGALRATGWNGGPKDHEYELREGEMLLTIEFNDGKVTLIVKPERCANFEDFSKQYLQPAIEQLGLRWE